MIFSFSLLEVVVMMGSTHKVIGLITGIAIAVMGVIYNEYIMLSMLFTVPIGAMLPDIDHNNSKLGKTRKKVVTGLCGIIIVVILVYIGLGVYFLLVEQRQGIITPTSLIIGILALFVIVLPHTEFGSKYIKFFTKHRGIMHTLAVPGILIYLVYSVTVSEIRVILLGFAIGYLTHLVADCLTKEGCPILWPLTSNCISVLPVRTNTKSEKFVAFILCCSLVALVVVGYSIVGAIVR